MKKCFKVLNIVLVILVMISVFAFSAFAMCEHSESSKTYTVISQPTCTESGWELSVCNECGEEWELEGDEPLGHSWNSGIIVTAATCSSDGKMKYTCTRCGVVKNEKILANDNHQYEYGYWGEGLCPDGGFIYYDCIYCDYIKKVTADPVSHMMTNGVCGRCGYSENNVESDETSSDSTDETTTPSETTSSGVKDHEHDFSSWKKLSEEKCFRECKDSACGKRETQDHVDSGFDGKCDNCGSEFSAEISLEKALGLALGAVLILGIAYLVVNLFKSKKE